MGDHTQALANAFEREKAVFEQNSEHLRSLNQLLWQVPLLAMTLTGGAWYGVAQLGAMPATTALLLLVGLADLGLVIVMVRVRFVFERILDATKGFFPQGAVNASGSSWYQKERVVVWVFSLILLFCALASAWAAINPSVVPSAPVEDKCQRS